MKILEGAFFLPYWSNIHIDGLITRSMANCKRSKRSSVAVSSTPDHSNQEDWHRFANAGQSKYAQIGSSLRNSPSLVLNADYTPLSYYPLSLWSWQDTLRAVFNQKVVVVSEYTNVKIRGFSCEVKVPSVIALKRYHGIPQKPPLMSRRKIFIRDGYRCQYCCNQFRDSELSLDHVIPRSKGGRLDWTNTVTACHECNHKKGQVSPEKLGSIGMELQKMPREPTNFELQSRAREYKSLQIHPDWNVYLL